MSDADVKPGALTAGTAVLWVATAALAAAAAARVVLYGAFQDAQFDACDAVFNASPTGNWPDDSSPCEQFSPMGWYLPYWGAVAAAVVFFALLLAAAVGTGRGRQGARTLAAVSAPIAVALWAVPGLLNLGWVFATAVANDADSEVVEYLRDHFPSWFGTGETALQIVFIAAAAVALWLLYRPEVGAWLRRGEQ
ncbi:hypothetical protein [Glycomyces sp. NPDC047010]|uniref:hypothetical protein n=1 Tax=Glycomyces sp. NPDC047010 TaxID=3155023 RepID=UPI003406575C